MNTNRRQMLKGLSLGAGSMLLSPMIQRVMANAEGKASSSATRAKRICFFMLNYFFITRPVCRAFCPRIGHGLLARPRLSVLMA